MGELVFNCLLLVACVVLACASLTVPIDGKDVLARYWPMGIMIVLVILLAIKTLRVLKKLPPEKRKFNPDFSFLKKAGNIRLVLAVVWLLIYSWFLPVGGDIVATIIFCLGVRPSAAWRFTFKKSSTKPTRPKPRALSSTNSMKSQRLSL